MSTLFLLFSRIYIVEYLLSLTESSRGLSPDRSFCLTSMHRLYVWERAIYDYSVLFCDAAVVYGRGVYFAQGFQYSGSNTYAVPDINGHKHVYQTRVLTGDFVVGNQTYIVPPPKPGSSAVRYDSVVDNPAAPSIFVIFSDTQAYPEYLIIFKWWSVAQNYGIYPRVLSARDLESQIFIWIKSAGTTFIFMQFELDSTGIPQ